MISGLENIVKNYKIYVDTSSLMCGQKDFFFLDLFSLLQKYNKKIYILNNVENELLKNQNFSEKKKFSDEGLEVLKHYRSENLVEEINCEGKHYADYDFIRALFTESQQTNICLFIEDKVLAKAFLLNFKKLKSGRTINVIDCVKIRSGKLVKWDVNQLLQRVELDLEREYQSAANANNAKLLINIVIDNSASVKGEKILKLKQTLINFNNNLISSGLNNSVEYAITIFRGFDSVQFKSYEQDVLQVENIFAGGIPFVDLAIVNSLEFLEERLIYLTKSGYQTHKPWFVLLLNGENYGDLNGSINKIVEMINGGRLSYFPFAMSDCDFHPSLNNLRRLKQFIVVKNNMFDDMFMMIYDLAKKRVNTPLDQPVQIGSNLFEGWTIK